MSAEYGDFWCVENEEESRDCVVCVRGHTCPSLRMERDSSKCDQCQHHLESGRRGVMGIGVTAAWSVLAPSQVRRERCLWVKLHPAGQQWGPGSPG